VAGTKTRTDQSIFITINLNLASVSSKARFTASVLRRQYQEYSRFSDLSYSSYGLSSFHGLFFPPRQRCPIQSNSIFICHVPVNVLFAESTFIIYRLPFIVTVYISSTQSSPSHRLSPRSHPTLVHCVPPSPPVEDTRGGGGGGEGGFGARTRLGGGGT